MVTPTGMSGDSSMVCEAGIVGAYPNLRAISSSRVFSNVDVMEFDTLEHPDPLGRVVSWNGGESLVRST